MVKYIDEKGLKRFAGNVDDQINNARYNILKTKGKANGIASLDNKGFVPLSQLGNLDMTFFEPVTELPTTGIKKHIYTMKSGKEGAEDAYSEYIYTGDVEGEYDETKWEKLGDFVPTFDLKEYSKKGETIMKLFFTNESEDGSISTSTPADKLCVEFADGSHKVLSFPRATASRPGGMDDGVFIKPIIGNDGFMSSDDKAKLDQIDTEALSQSIDNANTAADNTNAAISACETATKGAEKVNAELTDENVINVTDRNGEVKSTDLSGAVKAADDISRIKQTLGSYSDKEDIVLVPTETDKAISADGVKVTKKGWAIAEFIAEKGNEYLFKPNVTDDSICIFAEVISSVETRSIDYTYTYNEDGTIATATATYLGKTHSYTYEWDNGNPTITEDGATKSIQDLPTIYETTVGSYSPLVKLNDDAELPEDGYCRFMSHFQGNSSMKVAVSYKVGTADLNVKVLRDGVMASVVTQLGNLSQKQNETNKSLSKVTDSYLELIADRDEILVADGKEINIKANTLTRVYVKNDAYWKFIKHNAWGWSETNPLTYLDVSHIDWTNMRTDKYYIDTYYLFGLTQRAGQLEYLDCHNMTKYALAIFVSHGEHTDYKLRNYHYPTSGYLPGRASLIAKLDYLYFSGSTWFVNTQMSITCNNDPFSGKEIIMGGIFNFTYRGDTSKTLNLTKLKVTESPTRDLCVICTEGFRTIDLTGVTFGGAKTLTFTQSGFANTTTESIKGLNTLDVSNFTSFDMGTYGLFSGYRALKTLDLSNWDTSNVTSMSALFSGCNSLTSLDLSNWDTSNVTSMSALFSGCNSLTSLDLSNWDTSNVTSMSALFSGCNSLTSLDLSNWDTSNVTSMSALFSGCNSLTSLDLSNWDTSNVTKIDAYTFRMFNSKELTLTLGEGFGKAKAEGLTLDFSNLSLWKNDSVKTLLNLYDRVSNGLGVMNIKLHANTKAALGEDGIAVLTAKGYVIA